MESKIYRIILPCGGTYVGQTLKHKYQRWGQHLSDLDRGVHHNPRMQESYSNGEVNNWKWEVLETIDTDDKAYINLMEQHYATLEDKLINKQKIHINKKARLESYKEYHNKKASEYYYNNHEKMKQKHLKYYYKKKANSKAL